MFFWSSSKHPDLNKRLNLYFGEKSTYNMHFTVGNEVDFVLEKKNEGLVEHVRTLLKEGYTGRMFYYKGIVGLLTRLNRRDLQVIR